MALGRRVVGDEGVAQQKAQAAAGVKVGTLGKRVVGEEAVAAARKPAPPPPPPADEPAVSMNAELTERTVRDDPAKLPALFEAELMRGAGPRITVLRVFRQMAERGGPAEDSAIVRTIDELLDS